MENKHLHCSTLKANAKQNLKKYYWWAFLVCLIIGIVSGGFSSYSSSFSSSSSSLSTIFSSDTQNSSTSSSSSSSQSTIQSPYDLGYVEGYYTGYYTCYYSYNYNNPYSDDSNLTDDYSLGYKDGYDAGYMDCFNGNEYSETPPSAAEKEINEATDSIDSFDDVKTFVKEHGGIAGTFNYLKDILYSYLQQNTGLSENEITGIIIGAIIVFLIVMLLGICFKVFVVNPLVVGQQMFFQTARIDNVQFSYLGSAFHKGKYGKTVKTIFVKDLYIALWSLLLWIPGIIKTYSYALVPYIVAENPDIPTNRAITISKETMKGEKWYFFMLQLSFIGWAVLSIFTCGIGALFLSPYIQATYNEFYALMRQKAFSYNIATREELHGFPTKIVAYPNGFDNNFVNTNNTYNSDNNQSENPYYDDMDSNM